MVAPIYQPQFSHQHQQHYPQQHQQQQHVQQQPLNQQHQQPPQQARSQFNNQNHIQKRPQFDPIPMSYAELFPALLAKNHVQIRSPPPVPKDLPYWYKADQFCAYHQGAPGHSIENYFGLKSDVQRLVKSGILSFKDVNPNVQVNPLPQHGSASINLVYGCPSSFWIYDVWLL